MITDEFRYTVKRSSRRSLGIRVEFDGSVTVLAPYAATKSDIESTLQKHSGWLTKKLGERKALLENNETEPIYGDELKCLKARAEITFAEKLDKWSELLRVTYKSFSVKKMVSRWGSCSSEGNITLNTLLVLAPDMVIDYIIVHELSHIKHMDHSKAFYAFIDAHFPYRKECQSWLKEDGVLIINRARRGAIL